MIMLRIFTSLFILFALASCHKESNKMNYAAYHAQENHWFEAIKSYENMLKNQPNDTEIRTKLYQARTQAAEYFQAQGMKFLQDNNPREAIHQFKQGILIMPEYERLHELLRQSNQYIKADDLLNKARYNHKIGRVYEAQRLVEEALILVPSHHQSEEFLRQISSKKKKNSEKLVLTSSNPITLHFQNAPLKEVIHFIAKPYGINVIFDESVKDIPVTIFAKDVTFRQALGLIDKTGNIFHKEIGTNTILVINDNDQERSKYDDYYIRTFHLKSIKADDMSGILQRTLGIKNIITNKSLNTVLVRDREEMLQLAEKIIITNDIKVPEVVLEVEILEVNRTKTEELGINYGSLTTLDLPQFTGRSLRLGGSMHQFIDSFSTAVLSQGTVTMPDIIVQYLKKNISAKILANPKIRAIHLQDAKIHIGERVPLRSSTIQDATGQIRTTFEYRDVGIKLNITPNIHSDNDVTVKLNLEVSSIGQNRGTTTEPALGIGTRNIETVMLLKDNETTILGGLIQEEDRRNNVKVPGLGDVPVMGKLFSANSDEDLRNEILLTITPRIIRTQEIPPENHLNFFSGVKNNYDTKSAFDFLTQSNNKKTLPAIDIYYEDSQQSQVSPLQSKISSFMQDSASIENLISVPEVRFDQSDYATQVGQEIHVPISGNNFSAIEEISFGLGYDGSLLEFVRIDSNLSVTQQVSGDNTLSIQVKNIVSKNKKQPLLNIVFRARNVGESPLTMNIGNVTGKNNLLISKVLSDRSVIRITS